MLINISNYSFTHDDGQQIFKNISLRLDTSWKLGLIGRNGRGKTTFLKLLLGEYHGSGIISTPLAMEYFPFKIIETNLNGFALAGTFCWGAEKWCLEREASLLELSLEALSRPFYTLSGGEKTKLLLAIMFLRENSFWLIDEPTDHLDTKGRQAVGRYLHSKRGFILVSHDRSLLDSCIDHVLSINRENIELQRGNYSSWLLNREQQDQRELADNYKLKKDITRLEQSARRSTEWSHSAEKAKFGNGPVDRGFIGHKAAKMMQRAKSVEARRNKAVEEKAQLLNNLESDLPISMRLLPFHSKRLLECSGVSIERTGSSVLRDISLCVFSGERLALRGRNGCGKSTLLRLLAESGAGGLRGLVPDTHCFDGKTADLGSSNLEQHPAGSCKLTAGEVAGATNRTGAFELRELAPQNTPISKQCITSTGTIYVPASLRISYVPQDASFLQGSLKRFALERGLEEALLRAVLHRLGFERKHFEVDMANFSAGQKKKVLLAASLCEEAHLYIWDEPLNYIDAVSREQIEKLILDYQPGMLFVEHDQLFLERVATTVLEL